MSENEFHQKMKEAKDRVNAWPEWKKNILDESFKSKNDTPREPIAESSGTNLEKKPT